MSETTPCFFVPAPQRASVPFDPPDPFCRCPEIACQQALPSIRAVLSRTPIRRSTPGASRSCTPRRRHSIPNTPDPTLHTRRSRPGAPDPAHPDPVFSTADTLRPSISLLSRMVIKPPPHPDRSACPSIAVHNRNALQPAVRTRSQKNRSRHIVRCLYPAHTDQALHTRHIPIGYIAPGTSRSVAASPFARTA